MKSLPAGFEVTSSSSCMLRESKPFPGDAIDVRRLDPFLPVTAQLVVPKVISQDIDDVGFVLTQRHESA